MILRFSLFYNASAPGNKRNSGRTKPIFNLFSLGTLFTGCVTLVSPRAATRVNERPSLLPENVDTTAFIWLVRDADCLQ